jgi:hypothetical protein
VVDTKFESSGHRKQQPRALFNQGARYQIAADDRQQPPPGATRSRHQQPAAASTGRQVVVAGPASSNETRNTKHETKNGKREWGWESCSHTGPPPPPPPPRHTPHATAAAGLPLTAQRLAATSSWFLPAQRPDVITESLSFILSYRLSVMRYALCGGALARRCPASTPTCPGNRWVSAWRPSCACTAAALPPVAVAAAALLLLLLLLLLAAGT